jgi:hypothetical protein
MSESEDTVDLKGELVAILPPIVILAFVFFVIFSSDSSGSFSESKSATPDSSNSHESLPSDSGVIYLDSVPYEMEELSSGLGSKKPY